MDGWINPVSHFVIVYNVIFAADTLIIQVVTSEPFPPVSSLMLL